MQRASGSRPPRFHLIASMLAMQTPFTKMLTVVGQEAVTVFAHAGARPTDYLLRIEASRRVGSDPNRAAAGESSKRDLFHRPSVQATHEPGVVHDVAAADIDSVMQKATAERDEMRAQGRGFLPCQ